MSQIITNFTSDLSVLASYYKYIYVTLKSIFFNSRS